VAVKSDCRDMSDWITVEIDPVQKIVKWEYKEGAPEMTEKEFIRAVVKLCEEADEDSPFYRYGKLELKEEVSDGKEVH